MYYDAYITFETDINGVPSGTPFLFVELAGWNR